MKLVQKVALYFLIAAIPITCVSLSLLNRYIRQKVVDEIDERLVGNLRKIETKLRQQPLKPSPEINWDATVSVTLTTASGGLGYQLKDSTTVDTRQKKHVVFRVLRATCRVGKQFYRIIISQSYVAFDKMTRVWSTGIISCLIAFITLLVLADILIFRFVQHPFYDFSRQLKHYRIDAPESISFPSTDVDEFKVLRKSLDTLIRRTRQQYARQKQFTDNISAELQTTLNVLSGELDLLQQSGRLGQVELDRIRRLQQMVNRLLTLNQSLLLLAQIDNYQFAHREPVNIGELVGQLLGSYRDDIAHKGVSITKLMDQSLVRSLNRQLAEILFSNLISNAIRHGDAGRSILVHVSKDSFIITNEGDSFPFPQEHLFQQVVGNPLVPQSTGLGLVLVKEIADHYDMIVSYHYLTTLRRHMFEIKF